MAPDWSADWLHREATGFLEHWAAAGFGRPFDKINVEEQAAPRARLEATLRANPYDARSGVPLIIVGGSMAGEWLGIRQRLALQTNFWFGMQGLEYVDLGRFWQIFLFIGLLLWLALMVRAMGSVFSALEVVPLILIGFEAYENLTLSRARPRRSFSRRR